MEEGCRAGRLWPRTTRTATDRLVAVSSPLTLALTSVQDSFNYFLSSLRIMAEQTFGVVVARWGILWSPLRCSLAKASKINVVCCKLHYNIIDQRDKAGITAGVPSVPAVDPNNRTQGQVQVFVQDVLHLDSEATRHIRQGQGAANEAGTERCAGAGGRREGPWRWPQRCSGCGRRDEKVICKVRGLLAGHTRCVESERSAVGAW
jgi:hypothetical protein